MSREEQAFKPSLSQAAGMKDDNQLVISEEAFSTALDPNSFLCPEHGQSRSPLTILGACSFPLNGQRSTPVYF